MYVVRRLQYGEPPDLSLLRLLPDLRQPPPLDPPLCGSCGMHIDPYTQRDLDWVPIFERASLFERPLRSGPVGTPDVALGAEESGVGLAPVVAPPATEATGSEPVPLRVGPADPDRSGPAQDGIEADPTRATLDRLEALATQAVGFREGCGAESLGGDARPAETRPAAAQEAG
jgi:hypothetical protein